MSQCCPEILIVADQSRPSRDVSPETATIPAGDWPVGSTHQVQSGSSKRCPIQADSGRPIKNALASIVRLNRGMVDRPDAIVSLINANWPSPLEGLQRRIHCIDSLGDGVLLRLQSFDVGQLFINLTLCDLWGAHLRGRGRRQCRCSMGFARVTVPDVCCLVESCILHH